jgi:hypothetical protein
VVDFGGERDSNSRPRHYESDQQNDSLRKFNNLPRALIANCATKHDDAALVTQTSHKDHGRSSVCTRAEIPLVVAGSLRSSPPQVPPDRSLRQNQRASHRCVIARVSETLTGLPLPSFCIRHAAFSTIGLVVAAALSHSIGQAVQAALLIFNTREIRRRIPTSNLTN